MRKVYVVCENTRCNPNFPYVNVEVVSSRKKALALIQGHGTRWFQVWYVE